MKRYRTSHLGTLHFVCDDENDRLWKYGRLFLRGPWRLPRLAFHWHFTTKPVYPLALKLDLGGEDNTVGASVYLPFTGGFHLEFDFLPWKWRVKLGLTEERETGLSFGDGTLRWDLHRRRWATWHSRKSWRSKSLRERWAIRLKDGSEGSFDIVQLLLGKVQHESELLSEHDAVVNLPEGDYPVLVSLERATWKRPRGRTRVVLRANVQPAERAIPHPGKGTTSYNCGEDASFGLTCPAATVEEAVEAMRASVMRSRADYGSGEKWRPEKTWELREDQRPKRQLSGA